ncbi:hypothetical protein Tcan_18737 [Toxocara canis]|uniref:DUF4604 domain-containing protein n=2 Tax=Toxocara canis TaxID=6265 RepID=A0A0B2W3F8_TOXCA|nr:hypothetical protein Tcan_18737 [Toxocara canis]VDM24095.1 unnamed protein product [Toxocara canis]
MSGGKKLSYKEKSSIHFVDQGDPPFIKKLKLQMGYKEPASIDDKFASTTTAGYVEDDREEDDLSALKEEDRPQVVVLDAEKDLNEKQFIDELKKKEDEKDRQMILESKIIFKKPRKGKASKGAKESAERERDVNEKKASPNNRLLSFASDEDEDP